LSDPCCVAQWRSTAFTTTSTRRWLVSKPGKAELLVVLNRPNVLLNTNSSEQDTQDPVTIRKISGGPRSEDGRRCHDTFLFLKKICQKNAILFSTYLGDRLGIAANSVDRLSDIIRRYTADVRA
jgi:hypothetical protein